MDLHKRRNSSHSKFRLFDNFKNHELSPKNKEEQRRFAEALRQALCQAADRRNKAPEGDSTGQFSSIFTGEINNRLLMDHNHSLDDGGLGIERTSSPIRDSILISRRGSGEFTRQRSQHSLIVESVARILDDTALEPTGHEKQRMQMFNEPAFKTGPPSEVHQLMYDKANTINSQYFHEFDKKWNHQFDGNSLNSGNTPIRGMDAAI